MTDLSVYSIEDIHKLTGLARSTIYREINAGRLKTFNVGKRRLVSVHAYEKWIKDLEELESKRNA